MKIATIPSGEEKAAPEYADCKAIADRTGISLKKVMEKASHVYDRAREKRRTS
jgi:uncharacterized protein (DUF111 family)